MYCIGGSKARVPGALHPPSPPGGPNSLIFNQVFGKNLKNNSNFGSWRIPLGKILDPPPYCVVQLIALIRKAYETKQGE